MGHNPQNVLVLDILAPHGCQQAAICPTVVTEHFIQVLFNPDTSLS